MLCDPVAGTPQASPDILASTCIDTLGLTGCVAGAAGSATAAVVAAA